MNYPDEGELFLSVQKKSDTLIFFAHHFQGHKKTLRRHVEFVNELGFDAYVFNLNDNPKNHYFVPYSYISKKFGMKHALADQIEMHFNLLTDYKTKIIYAFSNVTGCCIEFMARHFSEGKKEIIAMVCDSGPGINFVYSAFQLVEHEFKIKFLPLKALLTPVVALGWDPSLHKEIKTDLQKFPVHFPLLSIRGWKDPMISPKHIDEIFEAHKNLNWKKLALPEAGHLNGLRDFASDYKPVVIEFLNSAANI